MSNITKELSKSLKNEKVSVLLFSGASSKQMMTDVKPTIEEKPDFIILHTRTNNLRSNTDPEEIANSIVNVAVSCKENVSEVVVSAILPRRDKLNEKGTVVNEKTKELCLEKKLLLRASEFQSKVSSELQQTLSK